MGPASSLAGHSPLTRAVLAGVLLTGLVPAAASSADQQQALRLLQAIGEAARNLSYDGTFIYRQGEEIETVRIIHRADERGERERLISLTGTPREVVRSDIHVTCVDTSRRSVFVEALPLQAPIGRVPIHVDDQLIDHYTLRVTDGERVAGRSTKLLSVRPGDRFRYGYSLWVDDASGLLLRSDLLSVEGKLLEQMLYTRIRFVEDIPDELLDGPMLADGYTVHEPVGEGATRPGYRREPQWRVKWVPAGFRTFQVIATEQDGSWSEHHLYSDGIATFSVYVEPLAAGREAYEGVSTMGALSAFGRVAGDNQLVVVGEVPIATVSRVGRSVSGP